MINVKNGNPICYRVYAGNISDISTLDDLRKMWTDIGISEKSPLILMDRGYPNQEEFVNLDRDGYRFLIGAKTSMKLVKDVIDQKNCEFYDQRKLFKNPCSQAELNKIVPFGFSLQRQTMVFFLPLK